MLLGGFALDNLIWGRWTSSVLVLGEFREVRNVLSILILSLTNGIVEAVLVYYGTKSMLAFTLAPPLRILFQIDPAPLNDSGLMNRFLF